MKLLLTKIFLWFSDSKSKRTKLNIVSPDPCNCDKKKQYFICFIIKIFLLYQEAISKHFSTSTIFCSQQPLHVYWTNLSYPARTNTSHYPVTPQKNINEKDLVEAYNGWTEGTVCVSFTCHLQNMYVIFLTYLFRNLGSFGTYRMFMSGYSTTDRGRRKNTE